MPWGNRLPGGPPFMVGSLFSFTQSSPLATENQNRDTTGNLTTANPPVQLPIHASPHTPWVPVKKVGTAGVPTYKSFPSSTIVVITATLPDGS